MKGDKGQAFMLGWDERKARTEEWPKLWTLLFHSLALSAHRYQTVNDILHTQSKKGQCHISHIGCMCWYVNWCRIITVAREGGRALSNGDVHEENWPAEAWYHAKYRAVRFMPLGELSHYTYIYVHIFKTYFRKVMGLCFANLNLTADYLYQIFVLFSQIMKRLWHLSNSRLPWPLASFCRRRYMTVPLPGIEVRSTKP
jgi:hypothetical protein